MPSVPMWFWETTWVNSLGWVTPKKRRNRNSKCHRPSSSSSMSRIKHRVRTPCEAKSANCSNIHDSELAARHSVTYIHMDTLSANDWFRFPVLSLMLLQWAMDTLEDMQPKLVFCNSSVQLDKSQKDRWRYPDIMPHGGSLDPASQLLWPFMVAGAGKVKVVLK